jgi:hypothetical protein
MSQVTDFFVYLASPGEARQIFEGWPEGMAFAVRAHPEDGFSVHLHHESQVDSIIAKLARQSEVEPSSLRVIPERPGHPTLKLGASQELNMLRMVEAQTELVESAEDYMINFNFAKDETPEEEYLADDEPDEVVEEDSEEVETVTIVAASEPSVPYGDYLVVDEATTSHPMALRQDAEGRILLSTPGYQVTADAELPQVSRVRVKADETGFFISNEDLPEDGDGCLVLPYSLASVFVDMGGAAGRQAKVLITAQGWHVSILPKVEAPREPLPAPKPKLDLSAPPAPVAPTSSPQKLLLNMAAGAVLAICLVGLGVVGAMFWMPMPPPQEEAAPNLDATYLDQLRARIFEQQSDE